LPFYAPTACNPGPGLSLILDFDDVPPYCLSCFVTLRRKVRPEGRIVPPGTSGELCTRGYSVMRGYWEDAEKTAANMNGAESLLRTLVGAGVEVCFGNPGTSEMHFVAALDRVEGMRAVLGLFEGAVTGMADGYGRMAEKPAATLLHLGPGLANGLANLHNARRASTPIINIVGDHATYHAQFDAPLASDVVGFARPVSGWVHSSASARTVAADGARAVQAALQYPGQIATLILPADTAWLEADRPAPALPKSMPAIASVEAIEQAAGVLQPGSKTMILIRGAALKERGLDAAGRVAAATGARIACDTFAPRCQRGVGRVKVERIPYFAEQIVEFMKGTEQLILVGASPPVSFFAYPNKPSWCTPEDCRILYLAHAHEDGTAALEALADAVNAPQTAVACRHIQETRYSEWTAESVNGRTDHRSLSS